MSRTWSLRRCYTLAIAAIGISALPVSAADAVEMADYCHGLDLIDGRLAGPAGKWILEQTADARFVVFGEAHNLAEVPQVVDAVHAELTAGDKEPWHLALEMGPWTAARINEIGVAAVVAQHPFSIAFSGDHEIALLERAKRRGARIWGLDQEFTALHPLQRLMELAPCARLSATMQ
jgi:hypothetical protein